MTRYGVKTPLTYPTDPTVLDALQEFGRQATIAALKATETHDPRDVDAAELAEQARAEAVAQAFQNGMMKHADVDEVVDDIPEMSVPWLLGQGHIEVVDTAEVFGADILFGSGVVGPPATPVVHGVVTDGVPAEAPEKGE